MFFYNIGLDFCVTMKETLTLKLRQQSLQIQAVYCVYPEENRKEA
jgi:hypothetical protein